LTIVDELAIVQENISMNVNLKEHTR
jgi:hypothetical protein